MAFIDVKTRKERYELLCGFLLCERPPGSMELSALL